MATRKKPQPTKDTKPEVEEGAPAVTRPGPYGLWDTDPDLEENGVWFDMGGFEFRCRPGGEGNPRYMKAYAAKLEPVREALEHDLLEDANELERKAMAEAYAETVIVDIRGNWVDDDGNELGRDMDSVAQVLIDLPRMFNVLRRRCNQIGNYRKKQDEKAGKE